MARQERAELVEWLLGRGFTVEQIRNKVSPMLLPAGRIVGDDGVHVSTGQICEETGIDLELLQAHMRALGLPRAGARRPAEKFDDFPQLRVGLAAGCAISRARDWFGNRSTWPAA